MGYTHYWRITPELDSKSLSKIATDFEKMIPVLEHLGVTLADGIGEGSPIIGTKEIVFNGVDKCGHSHQDLGITWPAKNASGVAGKSIGTKIEDITKSTWFAGKELEARACGGNCSHETFALRETLELQEWEKVENEKVFQFCKTAYKPYDLAVTVCLVIAKHHLKGDIDISSDGDMDNWYEAIVLCQKFLEYGMDFCLNDEESKPFGVEAIPA